MPNYYIPRKVPPSALDRTLANPFGVFFSLGSIAVAIMIALGALTEATPTPAFAGLSALSVVPIGLALTIGGLQTLRGIYHIRGSKWSASDCLMVELSGVLALALAWVSYSLLAGNSGNEATELTTYGTLFIAAGFLARGAALSVSLVENKRTEVVLEETEDGSGEA